MVLQLFYRYRLFSFGVAMISMSAFEVLGPIMVGPSSSHTAGALRIALVARSLAPKQLERVEFWLYNSFSHTHLGHGTDYALIAGILGLAPDDTRVREALTLAEEAHLNYSVIEKGDDETLHPNTVEIHLYGADNVHVSVMGESVGGGRIRISGVNGVRITFLLWASLLAAAVFASLASMAYAFACLAICPPFLFHIAINPVFLQLSLLFWLHKTSMLQLSHLPLRARRLCPHCL